MIAGLIGFGKPSVTSFSCLTLDVVLNQTEQDDKRQVNEKGNDTTCSYMESPSV